MWSPSHPRTALRISELRSGPLCHVKERIVLSFGKRLLGYDVKYKRLFFHIWKYFDGIFRISEKVAGRMTNVFGKRQRIRLKSCD